MGGGGGRTGQRAPAQNPQGRRGLCSCPQRKKQQKKRASGHGTVKTERSRSKRPGSAAGEGPRCLKAKIELGCRWGKSVRGGNKVPAGAGSLSASSSAPAKQSTGARPLDRGEAQVQRREKKKNRRWGDECRPPDAKKKIATSAANTTPPEKPRRIFTRTWKCSSRRRGVGKRKNNLEGKARLRLGR